VIGQITVIGVGLIGGSLALALKKAGRCRTVVGYSKTKASLRNALDRGAIDRLSMNLVDAVKDADVVVAAVPVGSMGDVFQAMAGHVPKRAIITDVGSVKGAVEQAYRASGMDPAMFVPGHPIAGTEKSGVQAAFAQLFIDHKVILTPLPENLAETVGVIRLMWQNAGAEVVEMAVEHHDEVLAATSHLPHILAFNLVDCLAHMHEQREIFQFAAGGFRDFTRIASSDTKMWLDISLANRNALLPVLNDYKQHLEYLIQAIENGDERKLKDVYDNAKLTRDRYGCDKKSEL